jgi:hypothetical protein
MGSPWAGHGSPLQPERIEENSHHEQDFSWSCGMFDGTWAMILSCTVLQWRTTHSLAHVPPTFLPLKWLPYFLSPEPALHSGPLKKGSFFLAWTLLHLLSLAHCYDWQVTWPGPSLNPIYTPGSIHVRFVVDKVALGQVFLRVLRFSRQYIIPPSLSKLISSRECVIC